MSNIENQRSSTPKVRTRQEAYRKMSSMALFYHIMTDAQKTSMKRCAGKNTLGKLVMAGDIQLGRIANFDCYQDYFLYEIQEGELVFIHKADVNFLMKQTQIIMHRGFEVFRIYRN